MKYDFTARDLDRFFEKIVVDKETECWNWNGTKSVADSRYWLNGSSVIAHRFAYFLISGEADKVHLIHTCKNKYCVNWNHLMQAANKKGLNDTYLCIDCDKYKSREDFTSNIRRKYGVSDICKNCDKLRRLSIPETKKLEMKAKKKEYDKQYREDNHAKIIEYLAQWRAENPEYMDNYREENAQNIYQDSLAYGARVKNERSSAKKEGKIYFIAAGNNAIKIGFTSRDPYIRMNALQVSYYEEFILLGVMLGNKRFETKLHREFKHLRIRGEWFRPTGELLSFIQNNAVDPEHINED
jgi:hypothetical protein